MATHTVVIDSSARSTTINVTPTTALIEVLRQACSKRGLDAGQYELKYNKKQIDHSLIWRLANLPRGAKLDLVQASRSASVVNVALQLPENTRLTSQFSSTTSLWKILRAFEEQGGSAQRLNLTQREASMSRTTSGAGRLYYAQPVLNFMGREFATFVDLQQNLHQLGFGGGKGSLLLRLSFHDTQTPLEVAMEEITQYFRSVDPESSKASNGPATSSGSASQEPKTVPALNSQQSDAASPSTPQEITSDAQTSGDPPEPIPMNSSATSSIPSGASGPVDASNRPTAVFLAPTSSTPQAARHAFNEADYEPTVDHAKVHQARLNAESRNKRLASSAELAKQETERASKLASVSAADIRVRFPDQTTVQSAIGQSDTGKSTYSYVRDLLAHPETPFQLRYVAKDGRQTVLLEDEKQVIKGLGLTGKVLLTFAWAPGTRPATGPVLKQELREQASALKVSEIQGGGDSDTRPTTIVGSSSQAQKGKEKLSGVEKENKLKSMLMKGFSKK